jgi:prepilin-type N-terminal cleavage/methylation domain-containing protein
MPESRHSTRKTEDNVRTKRHAAQSRQAGFTMIEALVGLVVFGVGILMLFQLAPRSSHLGVRARCVSEAMSLAQGKMEELRAMPAQSADLGAGTHVDAAELGNFTRHWVVDDDTPVSGMRRVTVQVNFHTTSADSTVAITTYF